MSHLIQTGISLYFSIQVAEGAVHLADEFRVEVGDINAEEGDLLVVSGIV